MSDLSQIRTDLLPPHPASIHFASGSFVHQHDYDKLRAVAESLTVEYESRAIWIAQMNAILGYDNSDGFHSQPGPFEIAENLVRMARELRETSQHWLVLAKGQKTAKAETLEHCAYALDVALRDGVEPKGQL